MAEVVVNNAVISDRLMAIQRTIAAGAPAQEVFEAIVADAWDLLGHEHIISLRTLDPRDPAFALMVASRGVQGDLLEQLRRRPIHEGAGGQAIREDRLVVMNDYGHRHDSIAELVDRGVNAAMAAPVRDAGQVIGSLSIASFDPDKTYSASEQMHLLTFAEHASLALAASRVAEKMREADRDREMFLAVVTHKLKTPLMVAAGGLELLERGADRLGPERKAEVIAQSRMSINEVSRMVDRMLRGARAELREEIETVDISSLVRSVASPFANVRPIMYGSLPNVQIVVKKEALTQALGTLLENAVAHSPDNTALLIEGHVRRSKLCVTISNRGRLPEDLNVADLFRPMSKGHDSKDGIGLGLYIVRRLARSLGGDVGVRSEFQTVTFELSIPFS